VEKIRTFTHQKAMRKARIKLDQFKCTPLDPVLFISIDPRQLAFMDGLFSRIEVTFREQDISTQR
jgi:hypothetical protein